MKLRLVPALTLALCLAACSSAAVDAGANADGSPEELRIGYQHIPNGDLVVKDQRWLESELPDTKVTWIKFDFPARRQGAGRARLSRHAGRAGQARREPARRRHVPQGPRPPTTACSPRSSGP
ncbi:hypothetical protein ACGFI3_12135 [Nonomuraea wenchangensis]|uniref:hypothetical protein n=1 Tax=Nonomuraea wenchangensis TaxID=568860 RepID=UPI003720C4FE